MDRNITCRPGKNSARPLILNLWTLISSLVAVCVIARSIYKTRTCSQPRFLSLAVCLCDFLYSAISNTQQVAMVWRGYCLSGGKTGCIIRGFCRNSAMLGSNFMVVFMAVERYISLKYPFKYPRLMSPAKVVGTAVGLYVYAIFFATLPLIGVNKYGYRSWCDFYWNDKTPAGQAFVILFLIQGFVCMTVILFCNTSVIYELVNMRRKVGTGIKNSTPEDRILHIKFIVIMTTVCISYIICSTPFLIRLILTQLGVDNSKAKDLLSTQMNLGNNMTNSYLILFIQILFHPKLVAKIQSFCCKKGKEEPEQNTKYTHAESTV